MVPFPKSKIYLHWPPRLWHCIVPSQIYMCKVVQFSPVSIITITTRKPEMILSHSHLTKLVMTWSESNEFYMYVGYYKPCKYMRTWACLLLYVPMRMCAHTHTQTHSFIHTQTPLIHTYILTHTHIHHSHTHTNTHLNLIFKGWAKEGGQGWGGGEGGVTEVVRRGKGAGAQWNIFHKSINHLHVSEKSSASWALFHGSNTHQKPKTSTAVKTGSHK